MSLTHGSSKRVILSRYVTHESWVTPALPRPHLDRVYVGVIKEYRLQQEEAPAARFPLPIDCDHGIRSVVGGFFRETVQSVGQWRNVLGSLGLLTAWPIKCLHWICYLTEWPEPVNDRNGNFTETQKQKPALENNRYSVSVSVSAESTSICRKYFFLQKQLVSAERTCFCQTEKRILIGKMWMKLRSV